MQFAQLLLLVGLTACSTSTATTGQASPGTGRQQRMKLTVGDIKEVSLARPADTMLVLTGSSDNSEVVDVSQKQQAGQSSPLTFLIKGVTSGTARVVFSEKRTGDAGEGQVRKIYLVQVVSK